MDNVNKTLIPDSLNHPTDIKNSSYGNWSVFIFVFIFFGIFMAWFLYKVFFSTFQKEILDKKENQINPSTNSTKSTTSNNSVPKPASFPTEIFKGVSKDNLDENQNMNGMNDINENNLNNAIDNKSQSNTSPIADDSYSNIQRSKTAHKSGWCYIGEERGFRSCIEVGDNDLCMSGNIFPTQEICINPTLRY